jgi:hypothetical protein
MLAAEVLRWPVIDWVFAGAVAAGFAALAGRWLYRRKRQQEVADASGLAPVRDLSHLPPTLQRTALWAMAEGGFERRVVHGVVSRANEDIDVTAFDLQTLRERRGEWAYLPVHPPFRIAGTVTAVVCELDRTMPHCVLKRFGHGDAMADDDAFDIALHVAKLARFSLQLARYYAAELPATLDDRPVHAGLAEHWRAYTRDGVALEELVKAGFNQTLTRIDRRDLVVELIDSLVVVYPAASDVVAADAFADLTSTALELVAGLLTCLPRLSPRGVETQRATPLHSGDGGEAS